MKAAGLLGQVCGYIRGRKGVGNSLPAEDPFPHLEPQEVRVMPQGTLSSLFLFA